MNDYIALLRGINVGKAKRIAMDALCALVERLGFEEVRAVLNTGNVVFRGKKAAEWMIADRLRESLEVRHGFTAMTVILTANDLDTIVRENPLSRLTDDASRFHVGFVMDPKALSAARVVATEDWGDEEIAVTTRAIYAWTPNGVSKSPLLKALEKAARDSITFRNWATVLKIQAEARGR